MQIWHSYTCIYTWVTYIHQYRWQKYMHGFQLCIPYMACSYVTYICMEHLHVYISVYKYLGTNITPLSLIPPASDYPYGLCVFIWCFYTHVSTWIKFQKYNLIYSEICAKWPIWSNLALCLLDGGQIFIWVLIAANACFCILNNEYGHRKLFWGRWDQPAFVIRFS